MTEVQFHTYLIYGVFFAAIPTFAWLAFNAAPYGRHTASGWGPTINSRWAWVLMESPAPLGFAAFYLLGERRAEPYPMLFFVLWQMHYIHRAFIYPIRMRMTPRPSPILIAALGGLFNAVNGYVNGRFVTEFSAPYPADWYADPRFICGLALFFAGFAINKHSDWILKNLRKPGETDYKIPRGGLYRWITCPNYLGEIIEWFGWALMTWSPAGLAFAVYTASNISPRAGKNHLWYKDKFPDYPSERKALIPSVW